MMFHNSQFLFPPDEMILSRKEATQEASHIVNLGFTPIIITTSTGFYTLIGVRQPIGIS